MTEEEFMLTSILQCKRSDLYLSRPQLTPAQNQLFQEMRERRRNGEPLQYITGCCEFMGLDLKVDERVLIPRPETEILVETAVNLMKQIDGSVLNILDLGTGSGNIPIALAHALPQAKIISVDQSLDALSLAKENAQRHHVMDLIEFIHNDMIDFCQNLAFKKNRFDMIISNPPYIPQQQLTQLPKDVQCEPQMALDGGIDGLDFYRGIIQHCGDILKPQGYLLLEMGDGQASFIQKIIHSHEWCDTLQFINDYRKTQRIVLARSLYTGS